MNRNPSWTAWMMTGAGAPLERRELELPAPGPGEALVAVAGCGVCHTDLSFLHHGVRTRAPLPLVLGHEISGTVEAVGEGAEAGLLGKPVVVPAVLPCGECALCRAGHRSICRNQVMPGNDRHGGFASHVVVPVRFLCPVPAPLLEKHQLWQLAVVSDAIATPFQAVRNSGLAPGELAVFVGVGGIGLHGVQIAAAVGARVLALDVDDAKLEVARGAGAHATLNVRELGTRDIRRRVQEQSDALGAAPQLRKIFETSGTRAGQETAWALLGYGASLAVVGFTMDRVEVGLSHLMAYEATARGNWGADPLIYPEVLEWIGDSRLRVGPFVERHPLDRVNAALDDAHHGRLRQRAVMAPG